jgi:ATP-binding cassette subfamily B protein
MGLNGGFLALVSAVELALAGLVLAAGPAGALQTGLLAIWVLGALGLAWLAHRRWRHTTSARLDLTHDLVESMVGHRTRLAQLPPESWHDDEDRRLERYLESGRRFDRTARDLAVAVPRGWLAVGLLGLAPVFASGTAAPAAVAVSLGGVLLAEGALTRLVASLWSLSCAAIAWGNTSVLFRAASRPEIPGRPELAAGGAGGDPVLSAERLAFRYRERGEPVLDGCSLRLETGERLLLEGASGAGKSTLASILTGLRRPESGLLLLGGLDRHTVGSRAWRRRVVAAPQFHENHVFGGSLALNLLLGRRWPPRPEDLRDAEALCRELGLGDLLERMPGGLWQIVGETGWQLSHGERSRLYVARALLQDADVVVLDESFAALDPETLRQALPCVLERAKTLLMIAHP